MIKYLPLFGLMGHTIFFSAMMLLGQTYISSEENSSYKIYFIIVSLLTIIFIFKVYLQENDFNKVNILYALYIISIIFICIFAINFIRYPMGQYDLHFKYASYFIVYAFFPFILGAYSINKSTRNLIYGSLKILTPLFTIILSINAFTYIDSGYISNGGGLNRLGIGYLAVQLIAILLVMLKDTNYQYAYLKSFSMVVMIIINAIIVIFSASRGPVIALIILISFYIYEILKKEKTKNKYKIIVLISLSALLVYFLASKISVFKISLERISTIFGNNSSIQFDVTNGRSELYNIGINFFKQSPIWGNGGQYFLIKSGYGIYPHNIFIELLSDYGIVGISIFLISALFLFYNLRKSSKSDPTSKVILLLLVVKFVELNFSGTFTTSPQLWFLLGFGIYSVRINLKEVKI